jgi:hypothetical protein
MQLRDFLPWRDLVIETSWPPNAAALEIRKRIGQRRFFGGGDTPFVGKAIGEREFRFQRTISYRNSFLPMVHAVVEPSRDGGARVRIRMRLHLFVMAFMMVWMTGATLGGGAVGLVSLAHGQLRGGLIALAFPTFGVALVTIPFAMEARIAERLLRELFAVAPGLPPRPETAVSYR